MTSDRQQAVERILNSAKYRGLGIPPETVADLFAQEEGKYTSTRELEKAVRQKLHNVMAVYLGDPDYSKAADALTEAWHQGGTQALKPVCRQLLETHASTRERLPLLETFYQQVFAVTGMPGVFLDLACGLHPFGLPWMALPPGCQYFAYDIHAPRIALVNHFFQLIGQPGAGVLQDILLQPPDVTADVAFFFKEAHRLEQRQHGANRGLWKSINTRFLLVSLPTSSLTGRRDLLDKHRRLVETTLAGLDWPVTELLLENEIIFCLDKR